MSEKKSKEKKAKDKKATTGNGDKKSKKIEKPDKTKSQSDEQPQISPSAINNSGSNFLPVGIVSTSQILTHFDETNGIAVSRADNTTGAHVVPLAEAYSHRYNKLRSQLTSQLLPKREHLIQLRRQLQNTSEEVEAKKQAIEKETLLDSQQILQRLKSMESIRQSAIQQEILRLEEDLGAIDRLVAQVEQAHRDETHNSGIKLASAVPGSVPLETFRAPRAIDMVELIHQFANLSAKIGSLSVKPITVQVDHPTDDFPKETAERLEIISRCDRYMHAVNVKDQMLWVAMQEKQALEEKLREERALSHEYAQEVASWADLTQDMGRQIATARQEKDLAERRNRELIALLKKHNIYVNQ